MSQKLKLLVILCLVSLFLFACTNDNGQDYETDDIVRNEYEEPEDEHVIVIEYWGNRLVEFLDGHIAEEVMYHALGRYGEYFFVSGDDWTEEFMQRMIAVSEDGIKFAKDWLGYESDRLFICVYGIFIHGTPRTNPYSFLQRGFTATPIDNKLFFNVQKEIWPIHIVHETVHAILHLQGRVSNFPRTPETSPLRNLMFLEEGLANLIEFLFVLESGHDYTINFTHYGELRSYHIHKWAIERWEFSNNFEDEEIFGTVYPQLMSHETAASFIHYLVTYRGTIEDFNRVFDDINLMEEIYGMNMGDMIVEWMEYLEQFR